jgi:hypothetical protein
MNGSGSNQYGYIVTSTTCSGMPASAGTACFPPGASYNNIFFDASPMNPPALSQQVAYLEEQSAHYKKEYSEIREQILNIRAILGMSRFPTGQDIRMSTALKELALELDKRADFLGEIDPVIKL